MLKLSERSTRSARRERRDHNGARPVFYYDDCCPLCRGYTAAFSGLGLSDRQGFSTIDPAALADLDLDRARHFIPLRSPDTGEVAYGLDGILGLVTGRAPVLGPIVRFRPVRRSLDGFYWLITYNRRHIVAAPPPATGIDCAPDYRHAPVAVYVGLASLVAIALAAATGILPIVALAASTALAVVTTGGSAWGLRPLQRLGHVASVALAAAIAGAVTAGLASMFVTAGAATSLASAVAALVGARKLWLRRWLLRER